MHKLPPVAFGLAAILCVLFLATGSGVFATLAIVCAVIFMVSGLYLDHSPRK